MLRVINRLNDQLGVRISRTLLAAHAVPPEFKDRVDSYVDLICREIIPAAKNDCDAVDAFCESIAFDVAQTRRVFEAGETSQCGSWYQDPRRAIDPHGRGIDGCRVERNVGGPSGIYQ